MLHHQNTILRADHQIGAMYQSNKTTCVLLLRWVLTWRLILLWDVLIFCTIPYHHCRPYTIFIEVMKGCTLWDNVLSYYDSEILIWNTNVDKCLIPNTNYCTPCFYKFEYIDDMIVYLLLVYKSDRWWTFVILISSADNDMIYTTLKIWSS